MQKKNQSSLLDQSLKAYAGAIRWGNFETAAAFAVPRSGANTVPAASLDGIKVTGYSIRLNSMNEEASEANVLFSFTFYDEARGTVGGIEQSAIWYFDAAKRSWLMDDSLPAFKG